MMIGNLGRPRRAEEDVDDSGAVALTTAQPKRFYIEVRGTGGYGEDSASITITDGDETIQLDELGYFIVEKLALLLGKHIPYATVDAIT